MWGGQQAKVKSQTGVVCLPTVTQFESASRQPLRVALRISASSPQGPKVRSPFVAPSCCGFCGLLCVSLARALRLLPRAPPLRPRVSLHQRASRHRPLRPLTTPPHASLRPSAALHARSGYWCCSRAFSALPLVVRSIVTLRVSSPISAWHFFASCALLRF